MNAETVACRCADKPSLVSEWAQKWLDANGIDAEVAAAWFAMSLAQRKELQRQVAAENENNRWKAWRIVALRWVD